MENKVDFLIEHITRKKEEVKLQNQVSEISSETTEWQTELVHDNWKAKEKLALELHQMGFPPDAIARILHIEEVRRHHPDRKDTVSKTSIKKAE